MSTTASISTLIAGLVGEAAQAPCLFSDLAKIERYIAESYKTRALIELLQNADDAGATDFLAQPFENGLVVVNNGRVFTLADVEALCRSGASNKQRGGATIGYRGIGFKSVVNLAEQVYVFSGEHRFLFDRERTRSILGFKHDVPLIRIPHLLTPDDLIGKSIGAWCAKYPTVFYFGALDTRLLFEDFGTFDSGYLLFLKHLERVNLHVGDIDQVFVRSCHAERNRHFTTLIDGSAKTSWEILFFEGDGVARVALKVDDGLIVPAPLEQATIHSFTPTTEYSGVPVKFNGDFTTDPSRKAVDLDGISADEFLRSCSTLGSAVRVAIERQIERQGLFGALTTQSSGQGQFRPLFWKTMSSILAQTEMALPGGFRGPLTSVRLRPEWLNHADYECICAGRWPYIDRDLLVTYPEVEVFLAAVGAHRLTLEDALGCGADVDLSLRGRAEMLARCVTQFRYDREDDRLTWLRQLPLFPTGKGLVAAVDLADVKAVSSDFFSHVAEIVEPSDLAFVLKRLGINVPSVITPVVTNPTIASLAKRNFQGAPAIAKWRSAERNALEFIKAMNTVLGVSDVSQANLGHDLEVTLKSGKRKLVEVKSVATFAEPFRLTSNEYAAAAAAGSDYVLAVVVNSDQFDIRFVSNPVVALSFERRCERWSWQCSDYDSAGSDPEQIFSAEGWAKE